MELIYDDETHRYTYGGVVVPSVTQILKTRGLTKDYGGIDPRVVDNARQRGKAVHKAIELYNQDALDEDALDIEKPYFEAYKDFEEQYTPIIIATEQRLFSPDLWYAGTTDLVVAINNRIGVVDCKCTYSLDMVATSLQLAAYGQLWDKMNPTNQVEFVAALHLKKSGAFVLKEVPNLTQATEVFNSALNLTNWLREQGREEKYE